MAQEQFIRGKDIRSALAARLARYPRWMEFPTAVSIELVGSPSWTHRVLAGENFGLSTYDKAIAQLNARKVPGVSITGVQLRAALIARHEEAMARYAASSTTLSKVISGSPGWIARIRNPDFDIQMTTYDRAMGEYDKLARMSDRKRLQALADAGGPAIIVTPAPKEQRHGKTKGRGATRNGTNGKRKRTGRKSRTVHTSHRKRARGTRIRARHVHGEVQGLAR
jgi:hypothetical protein